jgi:iron complex transport system substrate-binding protein
MRGKDVAVPASIERVATINDGFVEGVMTHLGVIDKIVAIGSWGMKREYRYEFKTVSGETYEYSGWNTMKYLHPWLNDLTCVVSPEGSAINFEALAKVNPDVVIVRVGDCTVRSGNRENTERIIQTIEGLGLPLIVINAPSVYKNSDLSTMKEEGSIIGELFNQREKAVALLDKLASTEKMIRDRTADILENERSDLLYFGLNPDIRRQGGAGSVWGIDTPESWIIESVAGARNAFRGQGTAVPMSAEQVYALDPDVIILPTANGYHPPRELYEAPYYGNLAELRAVKEKRVYAMPWTPMNCSRRLEYPIDMLIIAKAAYPERFKDISVYDFSLNFYREVYGLDEEIAKGLRTTQLLDWMKDIDF